MNKADFMRRLERGLRWTLPRKDVDDILADYNGFFASGAAEGRAETDVAAELGEPAAVARELIASYRGNKRLVTVKEVARFLRMAVYIVVIVWTAFEMSWHNLLPWGLVILVVFTAEMWSTLGGRLFYPPGISCSMERRDKRRLLTLHGCAVLLAGMPFAAFGFIWFVDMEPWNKGPLFSNIVAVTGVAVLITLFLAFNGTMRRSRWYFTVISHASGVIVELVGFWVFLYNLNNPDHIKRVLVQILLIYISGIVLSILYALAIRTLSRRRER